MARAASPHPDETELLERLRRGDRASQTAVVRRYHAALRRHANRFLHDDALAEDAVQDAWLVAFSSFGRFGRRCSLYHWLASIVLNVARNRLRHERRFPRGGEGPGVGEASDGASAAEAVGMDVTPERSLLAREGLASVDQAIRELPESQRSVIVLRDVWGASAEEVCRELRITDPAQRVRLCRARASLRRAVDAGPLLAA